MNSKLNDCYKRPALKIEDDIPIFSQTDFYTENYDRIAEVHLEHFEATGHNPFMPEDHWRELEKSTEELVKKYAVEPGIKILDVGVGMGRLLEHFPKLNRFGMDISLGYLRHAKAKGVEVCLSRIEEMPYKNNYFDMLVTTDVLEHVFDLNLALREMLSVVKEGGVVVVRVPYKEDLKLYLHPDFPYDFVHLRSFDESSLRILFEKILNVQVLEITFTGYRCGRPKVGANFRYYAGVIRRIMSMVRLLPGTIYTYISQRVLQPVEINIVIRNSKMDPKRSP
jgi:ubiquinone/menaquinone biosynthesis C-methylase UbiE